MAPAKAVLIVDDFVDNCRALARLIRAMGVQGVCVTSGEDALSFLEGELPAVILLDVMMPGMDGLEVLRRIRAEPRTRDVPVVLLTALSDPELQEHARQKGANDFWVKGRVDYSALPSRLAPYLSA